ncbi:hypothetical protein CFIICLFH_5042 [Methylobacterium goesingense]|uniref:Transposase InsO family protein n=1 Tax=Methylobacterium goesingense TaxID=243690 RepID=A0ABV2LCS8_9HYPH|nr:hypothetical protein CFIICLFH_5042 [Methylobacterium goesingense]
MGLARSTYYDAPTRAADDTARVEAMAAICDAFEAYNHARRLKTLQGLTPTEFILNAWTKSPNASGSTRHTSSRDHTQPSAPL